MSGTHGTSLSRAKEILRTNKFQISSKGYAGPGVYFWAYKIDRQYGIDLAECWWAFAKQKQGLYAQDEDQSCAVLVVSIKNPESTEFLDGCNQDFRETIAIMMRENDQTENDLPEITQVLIEEMEEVAGSKYKLVKLQVKTPPTIKGRVQNAAQMVSRVSDAYVVREVGLDLIENIEMETTGEYDERNS